MAIGAINCICVILWRLFKDDGTQKNRAVQINKHRGKVSAHIPLNIVPKRAQPLAQLESLGRGRDSLVRRTQEQAGGRGGERRKLKLQYFGHLM